MRGNMCSTNIKETLNMHMEKTEVSHYLKSRTTGTQKGQQTYMERGKLWNLLMITGEKPLLTWVRPDFLEHKKHEQ